MPLIVLKATTNPQPITLNFGGRSASKIKLVQYGITGLPFPGTVWLEILSQPVTPTITNGISIQFPLGGAASPNVFESLNTPLPITSGDNMWNDSHQLTLRMFDFNNNPIQFTTLFVVLKYKEIDPHDMTRGGINEVARVPVTESVGRNTNPLHWMFGTPHVDSHLTTSYPYKV